MVNITYGLLADDGSILSSRGTDLIVYLDNGEVVSYSPGDLAFVLCASALVWMMIPGLGFLYSGLVRRKNALSLLLIAMLCIAVVSFQWFFWGYSLAFSDTAGSFLGNLNHFGMMGVLAEPVPGANNKVPRILYAFYQLTFAGVVAAIALGAACERGRLGPVMLFLFCWITLVYCPIAEWVWNPAGWAFKWGVLDYAGGGPIEVCSGVTGLAYSIYLGKRSGWGTAKLAFRPHNVSHIITGTVFLWFGWLGFNGGSTFAANLRAAMAMFNTNLSASAGGLTWMFVDWRLERKFSVVGFCSGAICGLVAITPAAGYIGSPASLLVGFLSAFISNLLTAAKTRFVFDDPMDIFSCHAVAGAVGLFLTGLFAQSSVTFNDGYSVVPGGWIDRNWIQLPKQIAWIAVTAAWTFVVTLAIMFVIDHIPYCHFRSTKEAEIIGIDEDQTNEFAYDFVHAHRDIDMAGWDIHNFHPQDVLSQDPKASLQPVAPILSPVNKGLHQDLERRESSVSKQGTPNPPVQRRSSSTHRGRELEVTPLQERSNSPSRNFVTSLRERSTSRGRDYIQLHERALARPRSESRGRENVDKQD